MSKKVFFINSTLANYTDEEFSWFQKYALNAGVIGDSAGTLGLAVTANSPADMNVLVGVGSAIVELTKSGVTWKTILVSSAIDTLVIAPNSSGISRVDAIIVRIDKDAEPNALKNNIGTIEVVTGSGATALSDGAIATAISNDGFIRLADVTVTNGASSIVTGNIADTRSQVVYNSALLPNPKKIQFSIVASDPTTLVEGMVWFNSTSHTLNFYDGSTVKTLGVSSAGFNPLYAQAQGTPDMTLQVGAGVVKFLSAVCKYAGGNSSAFTAPASVNQKRIDLLCINSAGTLSIVQGTATTGSPSAPAYPNDKFVICEVYLRNASTSIKSSDDGTNGYIYKDVRYFCSAENPNERALVAGESLAGATTPVPVFVSNALRDFGVIARINDSNVMSVDNNYRCEVKSNDWWSQTFNSGDNNRIKAVTLINSPNGSSSRTITVEIFAVDGNHKPTGSALGTVSKTISQSSGPVKATAYVFATPITVSKNTEYAIVARGDDTTYGVYMFKNYNANSGYYWESTNNGSTWATANNAFAFRVYGYDDESFVDGKVYATKALKMARINFLGFVKNTVSVDENANVQVSGIVDGFTGLTVGRKYYVQDAGGIGLTKGTCAICVGVAVSATQIAISKLSGEFISTETIYIVDDDQITLGAEIPLTPSAIKIVAEAFGYLVSNDHGGISILDDKKLSGYIYDAYYNQSSSYYETNLSIASSILSILNANGACTNFRTNVSFYKE